MTARVVLWGATGHAKVIREAISGADIEIAAIFDNDESAASPLSGVPIFFGWTGFHGWRHSVDANDFSAVVAIGGSLGRERVEIGRRLAAAGIAPRVVVHPSAHVAVDAVAAEGSQILSGATLATEVQVGAWCIINTAASVDHECRLEEGVHIGPGAHLAGLVEVGACATVGTGAAIGPRVRIGAHSIVGAGAVVLRDVPAGVVVVGNPAHYLRSI